MSTLGDQHINSFVFWHSKVDSDARQDAVFLALASCWCSGASRFSSSLGCWSIGAPVCFTETGCWALGGPVLSFLAEFWSWRDPTGLIATACMSAPSSFRPKSFFNGKQLPFWARSSTVDNLTLLGFTACPSNASRLLASQSLRQAKTASCCFDSRQWSSTAAIRCLKTLVRRLRAHERTCEFFI